MIISISINKNKNNPKVYHNPFKSCYIKEFKDLLNIMNTQAVSPFIFKSNIRKTDNILPHQDYKIYFLDIDDENYYCDEVETILKNKNIEFIAVPSQSYPTKHYKKHFAIKLANTLPIPNENLSFEDISRYICDILDIDFDRIDTSVAKDPARFLAPASANPDFTDYDLYSIHYPGKPLEIDFSSLYTNTPIKVETISNSLISLNKGYFKNYPIVGKTKAGNNIVKIPEDNIVILSKQAQKLLKLQTATLKKINAYLLKHPQDKITHSCPICNADHTFKDTSNYASSYIFEGYYCIICNGAHCNNNLYVTEFKQYTKKELILSHHIRAYNIAVKNNTKVANALYSLYGKPHKIIDNCSIYFYKPNTLQDFQIVGLFKAVYHKQIKEFDLQISNIDNYIDTSSLEIIYQLNDEVNTSYKKALTTTYSKKPEYLFKYLYHQYIESIELFVFILLYSTYSPNTPLNSLEAIINEYINKYEYYSNIVKDEIKLTTKRFRRKSNKPTHQRTKKATQIRQKKAQTKKEILFQMLAQDKYKQGNKFKRALILQDLEKQGIKIAEKTYKRYLSEYKKLQK